MKLPESFTKVTLLSKILAILLFVSLPFIGFYFGVKYQQSINTPISSLIKSNTAPTPTENSFDLYVNNTCNFTLKYPHSLSHLFKDANDNGFSITEIEFANVFDLKAYQTSQDPVTWWKQIGKDQYPGIFAIAYNDISVGSLGEIHGKQILGQSKTPGGSTESRELLILPTDNCLIVIEDNTEYYTETFPGINKIINSFKLTTPSPSIPSVSPNPINKQITYIDNFKINFSYQLPPGWSAKKENDKSPIIDDTRIIEVLKITKGDYLIHVGGLQTGVAPCSENIAPHYEYIKLINPHISPVVLREVPNQRDLEIFGEYRIDVCSQIDESSDNTPLTTTIFGGIIYKIPTNYDDEILKEMDSIIESIKPL